VKWFKDLKIKAMPKQRERGVIKKPAEHRGNSTDCGWDIVLHVASRLRRWKTAAGLAATKRCGCSVRRNGRYIAALKLWYRVYITFLTMP